jgi:hypothetical protein
MDKSPVPQPERESYVKHRRDVTRQILLPVILVAVLGLGFAVLAGVAATGKSASVSLWADIAAIWVIIPLMLTLLIVLALTVGLVYGLSRLLKVSPRYTGLAQGYVLWFNTEVSLWADKIVQPVLSIKAWLDLFVKSEEKK